MALVIEQRICKTFACDCKARYGINNGSFFYPFADRTNVIPYLEGIIKDMDSESFASTYVGYALSDCGPNTYPPTMEKEVEACSPMTTQIRENDTFLDEW